MSGYLPSDSRESVEQWGFWDRLGVDDGGMPVHLPMGVNSVGQGPTDDADAHHLICWCGDPECPLMKILDWQYRLGAPT